jgi:Short C-terminal domain
MGMRRRARRRGLVAGAVAGGAIAHHRAKQQQQYDETPVDDSEVQYAPPPADPADQIEHLAQLHASGALSDDEFAAAKAKVLGS